jgi:hypothetical protein
VFYKKSVSKDTTVGDVRGKIVIFDRYGSSRYGISWDSSLLKIQDQYDLEMETKCKEVPVGWWGWTQRVCVPVGLDYPKKAGIVKNFLGQAQNESLTPHRFWINFASANYNGLYVAENADFVNPNVKSFFENQPKPIGSIVVMDYPNRTSGVIRSIIQNSVTHYCR